MKLPGVISLRNDLPIDRYQMVIFYALNVARFIVYKIPCAVSGRKKISFVESSVTPWNVLNIKLNWRISVQLAVLLTGQTIPSSSIIFSFVQNLNHRQ